MGLGNLVVGWVHLVAQIEVVVVVLNGLDYVKILEVGLGKLGADLDH